MPTVWNRLILFDPLRVQVYAEFFAPFDRVRPFCGTLSMARCIPWLVGFGCLTLLGVGHGWRAARAAADEPPPQAASEAELPSLSAEAKARLAEAARLNDEVERLYRAGKFAEGVEKARAVRVTRRELLGNKHPAYAASLSNLALLYASMNDDPRAEPLYLEALAIYQQIPGEKHPAYATILNNLALLYENRRDYARARPLYVEALAIHKEVLGAEHPAYATSLNNLAQLYESLGDYARAEPLYVEALAIRKEALGENHADYAASLNNLAGLYESLGDDARAEPLYLKALAIRKTVLGEKHPLYATSLNNLAFLFSSRGDYARAEPLYLEARAIRGEVLGATHPDYAASLNNLAGLYEQMGDDARAEPLYVEALAILKQSVGEKHPDYARSLNNLAQIRRRLGDYPRAEQLLVESRAIRLQVLGEKHPDYALSLNNLAFLYAAGDRAVEAEPLYREALRISRASLEATAAVQSERQQLAMGRSLRYQLDAYISLGLNAARYTPGIFREVLTWKGATLVRQRGMRLAGDDPAVSDLFTRLQRTSAQLASLSRTVPSNQAEQAPWRSRLSDLMHEQERWEAALSAKSAPFRQAMREVTPEVLLAALPPDVVLVDYLEFERSVPGTQKGEKTVWQRQLVAFVVRNAENPEHRVTMLSLGPVAPVGAAVDTWRQSFGADRAGAAAGRALRATVWEPILEHLGAAKTILISTDGSLGRIPFAALPGKVAGTYLIEDHRIAMIPVPQLLPSLLADDDARAVEHDLLVMGDIDYDAPAPLASPAPTPRLAAARAPRGARMRFGRLPGTKLEMEAVRTLFLANHPGEANRIARLDAAGATEARFRRLAPGCRFVHLATHGFFAPPSYRPAVSHGSDPSSGPSFDGDDVDVFGYAPNLLSGLVFAGANRSPSAAVYADGDDGVMTAEEIACLPLEATRLVTLSACETGLGETAGGEGLLGLQRAFQVSGARTTIAGYWKVDDRATAALMTLFYENLWRKKQPAIDALRNAQLTLLNDASQMETIASRGIGGAKPLPEAGKPSRATSPADRADIRRWAAFSLSGDWR